jgi:phospholipid-transporting ATPase
MHSFWSWVANGFYHSLILYFGAQAFVLWDWPQWDGRNAGHWTWGAAAYTANLATVLLKAGLITNIWTKYTFLAIPGSFILWFILMPIYATVAPMVNISNEYIGVIERLFPDPRFWAMVVVLPPLCLIRDFAWKYAKRMYFPQSYHHVQEIQKYNIQDYRPRYVAQEKKIARSGANLYAEWNNFRKPSARSDKSSVCASSVDMPSRKPTKVRQECCRRMILRSSVEDMERWQVRESSWCLYFDVAMI